MLQNTLIGLAYLAIHECLIFVISNTEVVYINMMNVTCQNSTKYKKMFTQTVKTKFDEITSPSLPEDTALYLLSKLIVRSWWLSNVKSLFIDVNVTASRINFYSLLFKFLHVSDKPQAIHRPCQSQPWRHHGADEIRICEQWIGFFRQGDGSGNTWHLVRKIRLHDVCSELRRWNGKPMAVPVSVLRKWGR